MDRDERVGTGPSPVDGPVPSDLRGIGRRFGAWWKGPGMAAEMDAALDRVVVSWHPGYAAAVAKVVGAMRDDVGRVVEAERAAVLVDDAAARDTVAPAPWRKGARLLGFLGSASAVASAVTAVSFAMGGRRGIDPIDVALLTAIASVVAVVGHVAALIPPARVGIPSRATSFLLELATLASGAATLSLWLRREDWDARAAACAVTSLACVVALAVTTAIVIAARMRLSAPRRRAQLAADERLRAMIPALLAERLEEAPAAIETAWRALHPDTRAAIERERDDAIRALRERGFRLDEATLRSTTPGVLLLPAAADAAWSLLHAADALAAHGRTGTSLGHFAAIAHERRARTR